MDARAFRIPYPPPATLPKYEELRTLDWHGRTVDFPDRGVSYVLLCDQAHVEQCVQEVLKTIAAHARGTEPARLEIRVTASPWNASA